MLKPTEPLDTPSSVRVVQVEAEQIPEAWLIALPFLAMAIQKSNGRMSPETTYETLCAGNMRLWLIHYEGYIGALVTEIVSWPTGLKVARFVLAGGRGSKLWMQLLPFFEEYGRNNGCRILEISGRPGWEKRLPNGWNKLAVEMEKDIA
ncbi:MAG: hypothetical protein ACR2P5_05360 [Gammaproteobacteria bacterium]